MSFDRVLIIFWPLKFPFALVVYPNIFTTFEALAVLKTSK